MVGQLLLSEAVPAATAVPAEQCELVARGQSGGRCGGPFRDFTGYVATVAAADCRRRWGRIEEVGGRSPESPESPRPWPEDIGYCRACNCSRLKAPKCNRRAVVTTDCSADRTEVKALVSCTCTPGTENGHRSRVHTGYRSTRTSGILTITMLQCLVCLECCYNSVIKVSRNFRV